MAFKNSDVELSDYLNSVHGHPFIHFEYEKGMHIIVWGPNKEEGSSGQGKTIGEAIDDLIRSLYLEEEEYGEERL